MQNYVIHLRSRVMRGADESHVARLQKARIQRFVDKLDVLAADAAWKGHIDARRCLCPEQSVVIIACTPAAAARIATFSNVRSVTCEMLDAA